MKFFCCVILILASFSVSHAQTTNYINKAVASSWRELADSGYYEKAIDVLLDSIQFCKKKEKKNSYWHIGQMYACDNNYPLAIDYMRKSTNIFDKIFDREWRLYFKGTIAFLKNNKQKLESCTNKLSAKHSDYYYVNLCRLKLLNENSDKDYKIVYEMQCE